ncbi:MAG: hypothetical protein RLZZ187_2531 [Pseudomonadota bacterium]|jgi:hypothetical protein
MPLDPRLFNAEGGGGTSAPSPFGVENRWWGPGTIIVPGGGAGAEPPLHLTA